MFSHRAYNLLFSSLLPLHKECRPVQVGLFSGVVQAIGQHMGVAQNSRARVTRVLVIVSIYQGAILGIILRTTAIYAGFVCNHISSHL